MTTTKSYDYLNRLTQISSTPSGSGTVPVTFNYTYNTANQRTKNVLADGSYWIYQYDSLGQVTSGTKYFADNTLVPGQQFGYLFDDIGNRKQTTAGGDSSGGSLRLANYSVNSLNQITNRDYPGTNDIIGAALATNSVTVNGSTNVFRKGEYFQATVKSNNTSSAQWEGISVASGGVTNSGNLYVPKTPEQFSYDADGNLTNDGRFAYTWDGENRLISMTNSAGVGPNYGLTFAYDPQGRRIQKMISTNGIGIYTNRFIYDGWNLIAEVNPANSLIRTYVWGTDLSGSHQGAGGVGGLLEVSYYGSSTTNCFPAYDGNGNVMNYINAADGTSVAQLEYDPFLNVTRATGPMANLLPFLGSTKYYDWETRKYYYGFRYLGDDGWLSRDPLQEFGGVNLYCVSQNDFVNNSDTLGLIGPLAGFALKCIGDYAANLMLSWLKNKGDLNVECGILDDYIRSGTQIPTEGFEFESSPFLNNAENQSILNQIGDCLIGKIEDAGVENLLKKVPEGVEKKLLEEAIGGGADKSGDYIKDLVIESSTKKSRATCKSNGYDVSLFVEVNVKLGDESFPIKIEEKNLGICPGSDPKIYGSLYDLACPCNKK